MSLILNFLIREQSGLALFRMKFGRGGPPGRPKPCGPPRPSSLPKTMTNCFFSKGAIFIFRGPCLKCRSFHKRLRKSNAGFYPGKKAPGLPPGPIALVRSFVLKRDELDWTCKLYRIAVRIENFSAQIRNDISFPGDQFLGSKRNH